MSLAGNLSDLSLGDILQILSLSHKSGLLEIQLATLSVGLVFEEGKLVTVAPGHPRELLKQFIEANYPDMQAFEPIARVCESSEDSGWSTFIQLFFQDPGLDPKEIARNYLQWLLNQVFVAEQGTFQFLLGDFDEVIRPYLRSRWIPIVRPGFNPQMMAMEAARASDEAQLDDSVPVSSNVRVVSQRAVRLDPKQFRYVVVDDNPKALEAIARDLKGRDLEVIHLFKNVETISTWVQETDEDTTQIMFLVDLVMPKADRSGVLGGFDVLADILARWPASHVILMTDIESHQIDEKIASSGAIGQVRKSSRRLFRDEPAQAAGALVDGIVSTIREAGDETAAEPAPASAKAEPAPQPPRAAPAVPAEPQDLPVPVPAELVSAPQETFDPDTSVSANDEKYDDVFQGMEDILSDLPDAPGHHDGPLLANSGEAGIALIDSMLDELVDTDQASEIVLLILRYASEVFDRAVLLTINGDFAEGHGQSGLAIRMADETVRQLRIPLKAESVFKRVFEEAKPVIGQLQSNPVHDAYFDLVEAPPGTEVFVAPLLADRTVVAILYGDNRNSERAISGTRGLQLFLRQAGLALDRADLRRKVQESS